MTTEKEKQKKKKITTTDMYNIVLWMPDIDVRCRPRHQGPDTQSFIGFIS